MGPKSAVLSFVKSVLAAGGAATLVGAVMVIMIFWPPPTDREGIVFLTSILAIVAAIAFTLVLTGTVLLGLPTTFVLRYFRKESETSYVLAGTFWGIALTLTVLMLMGGLGAAHFAILGGGAGALAGLVWWRTFRKRFSVEIHQDYRD
jgi:hypothetical protein